MDNISESFLRLTEEISATSGQLRYDPISEHLYTSLSSEEKKVVRDISVKSLHPTDKDDRFILLLITTSLNIYQNNSLEQRK